MGKYMFLLRGGESARQMMQADPGEWQAHMMKWKTWMDGLAAKGKLVGAEPLERDGKMVTDKGRKLSDGPFAEGREVVGGYVMVNASDINEAVEISKGCPSLEKEGIIEVRAVMELNI